MLRLLLTLSALALAVLALSGCERAQSAPAPGSSSVAPLLDEESALARFLRDVPPELGSSRADVAALLGAPDSVHVTSVTNRHDPTVADSIYTLHYDGAVVTVYHAGYDGKEMIAALELSDARHLRGGGWPRIGATSDAVVEALGPPDETGETHLEFTCEECLISGHETVRFVLDRGRVARIQLQYWLD